MTRLINGKELAKEIQSELAHEVASFERQLSVGIVYAGNHPVIEHFIAIKERFARAIGVHLKIYRFTTIRDTEELENHIHTLAQNHDGVVIQLPLPDHIDTDRILDCVPLHKDIDMLSIAARDYVAHGHTEILPPVAGAIREITERLHISLLGKKVVLVGKGKLVGIPVFAWLKSLLITPTVIDRDTTNLHTILSTADVIISGVGIPTLITAGDVKDGVVLFDAGTSELAEKIVGDIDPSAYAKASLYTPVPGGIGPLTVACLFKNLIIRAKNK